MATNKSIHNIFIKKHFEIYKNHYSKISKKNLKKIKLYPGVIKTLRFQRKKLNQRKIFGL